MPDTTELDPADCPRYCVDMSTSNHRPWLTLYTHDFGSSALFGMATPSQRGVWFSLLLRAAYEANGPRLPDVLKLTDRQLQQWCSVSRRELLAPNPLISIEDEDVVILFGYPDDETRARHERIRKTELSTERKRRYRAKLARRDGTNEV